MSRFLSSQLSTQQRNKNADMCDSFAVTYDYVALNLMLDAEFRMLTIVSIEIILLDFLFGGFWFQGMTELYS